MRKRLLPAFGLLAFVFMAISALTPQTASAATISGTTTQAQHTPHWLLRKTITAKPGIAQPFAAAATNMTYHGGSVMAGTTSVYAIFWEPTGNVAANYNSLIQRYFGDVGGSGLYANNTQYTSSSGTFASNATLAGSWVDSKAYPETPLLDSDIQSEVSRAMSTNSWTASTTHIFFVFTQANENECFDSSQSQCASNTFCAYHSYFGTHTIYAMMPYAASFSCNPGHSPNSNVADQTINVTSHEQMEAATDPLLNAWYDSTGAEIGDKCAWVFGSVTSSGADVTWNGHGYIVQKEWDNKSKSCVLTGP